MIVSVRVVFFFFKQKTAYEMRISDWSSDVCSSDLAADALEGLVLFERDRAHRRVGEVEARLERDHLLRAGGAAEAALHAGLLAEAEPRPVLVVEQRAGGAGGDAGEAEGAARSVDGDAAEGRARRQRQIGRAHV